jgi:uncharacterized protein YkwD
MMQGVDRANILGDFVHMGAAAVMGGSGDDRLYWTLVFA